MNAGCRQRATVTSMNDGENLPVPTPERLQKALVYAFLAGICGGIVMTCAVWYIASGVSISIGG